MVEKATFALNCFWEPQYFFSKLPGVTNTTVGYAGGEKENPTYHDLVDHTETLEIEFDPEKVSYEELLGHFFRKHDPSAKQSIQYKSIIFYHNDAQRRLAEKAKTLWEEKNGKLALTEVREVGNFYPAEEYHQHYIAKAQGEV